jgi:hypothetical protein
MIHLVAMMLTVGVAWVIARVIARQFRTMGHAEETGEPYRVRPPLRWCLTAIGERDAVERADRLAVAPQAERDRHARRVRAWIAWDAQVTQLIRAHYHQHRRWPRPGEIVLPPRPDQQDGY